MPSGITVISVSPAVQRYAGPPARNCSARCSAISVRWPKRWANPDSICSFVWRISSMNARVSSTDKPCNAPPCPCGISRSAHTRVTFSRCPRRATSGNSRKLSRCAVKESIVRTPAATSRFTPATTAAWLPAPRRASCVAGVPSMLTCTKRGDQNASRRAMASSISVPLHKMAKLNSSRNAAICSSRSGNSGCANGSPPVSVMWPVMRGDVAVRKVRNCSRIGSQPAMPPPLLR